MYQKVCTVCDFKNAIFWQGWGGDTFKKYTYQTN